MGRIRGRGFPGRNTFFGSPIGILGPEPEPPDEGTIHEVTLKDPLTLSESLQRDGVYTRAFNESLSLTEALSRTGSYTRQLSDDPAIWNSPSAFDTFYFKPSNYFQLSPTFARAGEARYVDENGILITAPIKAPRLHHYQEDGTRSLKLEGASENLCEDADISGAWWSNFNGTPVVVGSQADPAGGTGAYSVEDDNAAGPEARHNIHDSFTGDGEKVCSVYIKQGTSTYSGFGAFMSYRPMPI